VTNSDATTSNARSSASRALDEYLVVECQLGNTEAFEALVRRWQGPLVLRAQAYTKDREAALDVAQEAWMGILRGLSTLRDPGRFRGWAMSIVANKAHDWIRRERSRRAAGSDARVDATRDRLPDDDLERIREGIARLEPSQRRLLRYHYIEGRSLAEIATELGIPEGTVKSRLSKARNQLRLRLEED
jgi:RNA polymerase sigma-70 factor (ECF subfamily)